jgi:hypothetical protein
MGVWGAGLYSGDFAMDLRAAVAAVARLPLSDAELVEALRSTETAAADNPADPDHSIFWLVLADQLARRGVYPPAVKARALEIIDEGLEIERLRSLGAGPADLRKRQAKLEEIRTALVEAAPKARTVMSKPQPLSMGAGDVVAYPTSSGNPINPYFKSKDLIRYWKHDGWGVFAVVECGHVFDYLAWVRIMTLDGARTAAPDMAALWAEPRWRLQRAGTCSPLHFKRMECEIVGRVAVDATALERLFPDRPSPRTAAIIDKSIANRMHVTPRRSLQPERRDWSCRLDQIAQPID